MQGLRVDNSPLPARYQASQRLTSEAVRLSTENKYDNSPASQDSLPICVANVKRSRKAECRDFIDNSPALPESLPDFIHKIPQSPQKMSTLIFRVLIFLKPEYVFLTVFTCHIQRIRLCNLHIGIFNHVVVILNLICLKDSIF